MISPGKTQKVVVNIPTKYIKTKDLYTKNVEVETNDPDASVVKLAMRLRVVEILAITPAQVNFGKVKPGSTSRQEITILNKGKDTITLTRIVPVLIRCSLWLLRGREGLTLGNPCNGRSSTNHRCPMTVFSVLFRLKPVWNLSGRLSGSPLRL
ncbi:MAG: hypothetical protein MZU91_13360 [Desulfosudis oleivorans]|nr:hypothetical protein [Desulfosudis oleivorans]